MDSLSSQLLVEIITQEMSMPVNSVWLRDQNRMIPNDNGLYIIAGIVGAFTMANETRMKEVPIEDGVEVHQISEIQQQENIQIDIISKSNDAIFRNWEVIAALQSFYSQQIQEKYNFKIFRIPRSFINLSSGEGGSIINRYSITVSAMVWYRKDTILTSPLGDYYDDFRTRVDDEKTIGTDKPLIEFEINSGGIVP